MTDGNRVTERPCKPICMYGRGICRESRGLEGEILLPLKIIKRSGVFTDLKKKKKSLIRFNCCFKILKNHSGIKKYLEWHSGSQRDLGIIQQLYLAQHPVPGHFTI